MLRTFAVASALVAAFSVGKPISLPDTVHETSGLIPSRRDAWSIWTINDSGNEPELIELNATTGSVQRIVRVADASNVDWEAITALNVVDGQRYIYVGDTGGNVPPPRKDFFVYRMREPEVANLPDGTKERIHSQRVKIQYPDFQNHDCEAMVVVPAHETIYFLTKSKQGGGGQLFKVDDPRWGKSDIAELVGSIDLSTLEKGAKVTDMAFNADGTELSILTYKGCYSYKLNQPYDIESIEGSHPFRVIAQHLKQAEGVCYGDDGALYLSSEKQGDTPATLVRIDMKSQ
jgi:hypothetical protein